MVKTSWKTAKFHDDEGQIERDVATRGAVRARAVGRRRSDSMTKAKGLAFSLQPHSSMDVRSLF